MLRWLALLGLFMVVLFGWRHRRQIDSFLDRLAVALAILMVVGASVRIVQWLVG